MFRKWRFYGQWIRSKKGATLEVLNFPQLNGIQDENLWRLLNNLILELYKYQAESDRARIKERQRQGIALAKERGKYKEKKEIYERRSKVEISY